MTNVERVIAEAKQHFLANGRTGEVFVVSNDDHAYYCDAKSLRELHLRDHHAGLHPIVCGSWGNETFLGVGVVGYKYFNLIQ